MPITEVENDVYAMVRHYNYLGRYIEAQNIEHYFKQKYTKQEVGYALQLLKKEHRIGFTRKRGWLIK